jgi:hypothetical protein
MNIYWKSFATIYLQNLSPNVSDARVIIILGIAHKFESF